MSNGKDLVAEMIPTLCEKFMGQRRVRREEDGRAVVAPTKPAEDARELFDALDALTREQKIRTYQQVLDKTHELSVSLMAAIDQRNWKMTKVLATQYLTQLTSGPLEVIVAISLRQEEVTRGIDDGPQGVTAFLNFTEEMRSKVDDARRAELGRAVARGRTAEPDPTLSGDPRSA